jgi:hypothetical protein
LTGSPTGEEDALGKGDKKQKKAKKEGKKEKKRKELFPADGANEDPAGVNRDKKGKKKTTSDKTTKKPSSTLLKTSLTSTAYLAASQHQGPIQGLDRRMTTFLLSFLSGHDLLSARLVSKRWAGIIGKLITCAVVRVRVRVRWRVCVC